MGLVGESGSGKSVTARAALGLIPDGAEVEGTIVVDGLDVRTAGPDRLRQLRAQTAAMVFQDPRAGINPLRRIEDYLIESDRYARRSDVRAARRTGARPARPPWGSRTPRATCASTRTSCRAGCCSG